METARDSSRSCGGVEGDVMHAGRTGGNRNDGMLERKRTRKQGLKHGGRIAADGDLRERIGRPAINAVSEEIEWHSASRRCSHVGEDRRSDAIAERLRHDLRV